MPTDSFIQVPLDGGGKRVDTTELTVGGQLVERQRINITDDQGTGIVDVVVKGSQATGAMGVQALIDSGRVAVCFYASGTSAGANATETAVTLTKSSGTSATSSASSFVVTSGKILRIQTIVVGLRPNNVTPTAARMSFSLRINTGGAVTTSSTPLVLQLNCSVQATAGFYDREVYSIPDGYEITGNGTLQIGLTSNAVYATNAPSFDVLIVGFEY